MSERKHSLGNGVRILEDIAVPEPQDTIPTTLQELGSFRIMLNLFFLSVLRAVQFDDHLGAMTNKIDNIVFEWSLAAKVKPKSFAHAQAPPENALGIGKT